MPFIFLPFIRVNPCPSVVKIFVFFAFFAAISGFGCGLPRCATALEFPPRSARIIIRVVLRGLRDLCVRSPPIFLPFSHFSEFLAATICFPATSITNLKQLETNFHP